MNAFPDIFLSQNSSYIHERSDVQVNRDCILFKAILSQIKRNVMKEAQMDKENVQPNTQPPTYVDVLKNNNAFNEMPPTEMACTQNRRNILNNVSNNQHPPGKLYERRNISNLQHLNSKTAFGITSPFYEPPKPDTPPSKIPYWLDPVWTNTPNERIELNGAATVTASSESLNIRLPELKTLNIIPVLLSPAFLTMSMTKKSTSKFSFDFEKKMTNNHAKVI